MHYIGLVILADTEYFRLLQSWTCVYFSKLASLQNYNRTFANIHFYLMLVLMCTVVLISRTVFVFTCSVKAYEWING